jgi:hypothetical protein
LCDKGAYSPKRTSRVQTIDSQDSAFTGGPLNSWTSDAPNGGSEISLGEVTDLMALVDLLVNHINTIDARQSQPTDPDQRLERPALQVRLFVRGTGRVRETKEKPRRFDPHTTLFYH